MTDVEREATAQGASLAEWWQVYHVESGATVYCRNRLDAEAHVREAVSGPWVVECVRPDSNYLAGDYDG